jgi:hypothetical protein
MYRVGAFEATTLNVTPTNYINVVRQSEVPNRLKYLVSCAIFGAIHPTYGPVISVDDAVEILQYVDTIILNDVSYEIRISDDSRLILVEISSDA